MASSGERNLSASRLIMKGVHSDYRAQREDRFHHHRIIGESASIPPFRVIFKIVSLWGFRKERLVMKTTASTFAAFFLSAMALLAADGGLAIDTSDNLKTVL